MSSSIQEECTSVIILVRRRARNTFPTGEKRGVFDGVGFFIVACVTCKYMFNFEAYLDSSRLSAFI